jgi:hypothetical protein
MFIRGLYVAQGKPLNIHQEQALIAELETLLASTHTGVWILEASSCVVARTKRKTKMLHSQNHIQRGQNLFIYGLGGQNAVMGGQNFVEAAI